MIAGPAIKSTVMDLIPGSGLSNSNHSFDSSSTKSKESVSFESLLNKKAVSNQTRSGQTVDQEISDMSYRTETKRVKDLPSKEKTVEPRSSTSNNVKKEVIEKVANDSTAMDDKKLEQFAQAIKEVKEEVMKTLNVTEEELVSMMEALGLTMMDLVDPIALKQLTLENAGTNDFMLLLTDEGLNQQYTDLLHQIQGILDQSGITQEDLSFSEQDGEFLKLMELLLASKENEGNTEELLEGAELNSKEINGLTTLDSNIDFTVERVSQEEGTSSQTSANTDSNQSKEQGATKTELTNQFLNQMMNVTNSTSTEFGQQVERLSGVREIASQILEQIKLIIKPTQTSMEFTLNPENLGKVGLNITSKQGLLTATFTTENQIAKEAIESQLQVFKENLNNQGIKVEAIEVNVSNFSFEGSTQMDHSNGNQQEAAKGKKASGGIDLEDAMILEESLTELVNDNSADYGNNFDYTA